MPGNNIVIHWELLRQAYKLSWYNAINAPQTQNSEHDPSQTKYTASQRGRTKKNVCVKEKPS